jgi:hypothetical protein
MSIVVTQVMNASLAFETTGSILLPAQESKGTYLGEYNQCSNNLSLVQVHQTLMSRHGPMGTVCLCEMTRLFRTLARM